MILWTILTALLAMTLLIALTWALIQIRFALLGIRKSLEKITMGVRAIEVETSPLPDQIGGVASTLTSTAGGLTVVRDHLGNVAGNLVPAAKNLGLL